MTLPLKCLRCGQSTHMVDECQLPVLPDSRVLGPATSRTLEKEMDEQPEALRLADDIEKECPLMVNTIALLRTQHADIERKDALLRQAAVHLSRLAMAAGAPTPPGVNVGWIAHYAEQAEKELRKEIAK